MGGNIPVGQGIADRHDPARRRLGHDIQAAQDVPIVHQLADRHVLGRRVVPEGRQIIGLAGVAASDLETRGNVIGQINADGDIGQRREFHLDGIADQNRADGDGGFGRAAERDLPVGPRHHRGPARSAADIRRPDPQLAGAISIRQPNPECAAAEADARVHTQGQVGEGHAVRRGRCGRPCADPMFVL